MAIVPGGSRGLPSPVKEVQSGPRGSGRSRQLTVPSLKSMLCAQRMPKAPFNDPATYEAALEELEQLVGLIESGKLPLEQLMTGYERGAELLAFCRGKLEAVENQIKVLDGGVLKPWTPE